MKEVINVKVSEMFPGFPDASQQSGNVIIHKKSDKPRSLSLKERNIFHKKKHRIMGEIYDILDDDETLYGARAINIRVPKHLDRHTKDADVYTPTPHKEAREAEKRVDTMMGFDAVYVIQGEHHGTWKLKAHATDETYADFTQAPKNLPREKIRGIHYPTLNFIEKSLKRTLSDPTASYRHAKDQDALGRIQIYKRRMF